jgi:hypothetical protein
VTTNMQEILLAYHRGIEVGRAAARHEMDEFSKLTSTFAAQGSLASAIGNMAPKRNVLAAKSTAKPVDSGTKKALGPRTKGVKEAILALLTSNPMSAGEIIANTGFKGTSVRATLMGIKKAGLAMNIDGQWVAVHHDGQGNSEQATHAID